MNQVRSLSVLTILALATAVLLALPATSYAVVTPFGCSATYDPQRSYCEPAQFDPWTWKGDGYYSRPVTGPYATMQEAIDSIPPLFVTGNAGAWCSETFRNATYYYYDSDHNPQYGNVEVGQTWQATYDATGYEPQCNQNWTAYAAIKGWRGNPYCPQRIDPDTQISSIHLIGGGYGHYGEPYCATPWTDVHKRRCDLEKGNPCAIMGGAKIQRETDYVGAGPFPLIMTRTYDSANAYARNFITSPQFHPTPLGVGWSGTYFQSVTFIASGPQQAAIANRPDGQRIAFIWNGASYSADADVTARLTEIVNGAGTRTGWRLVTSQDDTEQYSVEGRLLSIRGRNGGTITLQYGTSNYPSSVSDSHGHTLVFNYSAGTKNLTSISLPGGSAITLAYDQDQMLTTATYPGAQRVFHYEQTGGGMRLLTGITDESNNRFATWVYDSSGRVSSSEHAGGVERYLFAYTANGSRVVTDPLNQQRTYTSAVVVGARRITGASLPCAGCDEPKAVTYDANGNVFSRTDFNNTQTRFGYDLSRNLENSRTEAYGTPRARTITTSWHPSYRLPTQINEPGKRTTLTYDANGNVLTRTFTDLSVTPNVSRTWTYTYNSFGQVLTADGPRTDVSDVTTYTYYNCTTGYQCGQLQTIDNALNQTTTYHAYNAHGQPLSLTDPNGLVTTLTYDLRQRLSSRTVGSEQTTFEYWPTGLLKKATLPDASYIEYTYDAAHRLTGINDAEGNRIAYTLDAMGNRTHEQVLDPSSILARTRTRVFNTLNQLSQDIGAAGSAGVTTTFNYDQNGNQTSIAAPLGRNTTQTYDELNRLAQVTDPAAGVTRYGYNALDQLISVTDPRNLTTAYSYNGLGDLKQQASPDTGTTINTYDSGGNLKTSKDARNKTATYSYDALNRVTQIAYGDQTIIYGYDAGTNGRGQLTSASDSGHSMSWTYDSQGRMTGKTQVAGTITKSMPYGYNSAGQRTSLTTPSGQLVSYGYTNGRITSISVNGTPLLSNVFYDPFGPPRQWTWGNGTLAARTFDQDGKVTQIDSAGLKTYVYDDAFRITGVTDTTNSNLSWTYGYDPLDRLTTAINPTQNFGWGYDADGNRLTQSGAQAQTLSYPITNNRVSSITGGLTRTYAYDAAGNILGDGARTYAYNNRGRMKSTTTGAATVSYTYNALGQRIRKTGTTRLFVYDEAGHLLSELNSAGALVQETIWLGDIPVATIRPKTGGVNVFYVHTDHLNTPRKVSRPSDNKLRWRWDPDPFGNGAPNGNPQSLGAFSYNLRFPGQYYDQETGLHYNYLRDCYDPATGRYCQPDPLLQPNRLLSGRWAFYVPFMIKTPGRLHPYAYVSGNPLRFVDPLGLQEEDPSAPEDTTGAGQKAQEACDYEAFRTDAEKDAGDARAKGDYEKYNRLMRRAHGYLERYYKALGTPLNPADYGAE